MHPTTRNLPPKHTGLLLAALLSVTGCYRYTEIQPAELPRLNGAASIQTGTSSDTRCTPGHTVTTGFGTTSSTHYVAGTCSTTTSPIMAHTQSVVRTPTGTTTAVVGTFDAEIQASGQPKPIVVQAPVESRLEDDDLIVAGANQADLRLPLNSISAVRLKQPDPVGNTVAATFGGLAVGLLLYVAVAGRVSD